MGLSFKNQLNYANRIDNKINPYQFKNEEIMGGRIAYNGDTDYKISSEEMKEFVGLIKNSEYYRDGKVNNVIEGYLYHIQLDLKGGKFIYIILSDQEYLIKSDMKYKIISTRSISEHITNMLYGNQSDNK